MGRVQYNQFRGPLVACFAGCLLLLTPVQGPPKTPVSTVINVLPADLISQPPGANWLSYNGDFSGQRYSSLSQITVSNVAQLRAQWVFHAPNSDRLEVTPVVVNGIMFVTAANDTYALDARTGRIIWHYPWPITEGLIDDASRHLSRAVALWHSRVYRLTDNAHLLCLDARSGHLLWDVPYADWNKNYGATGAPLV
ncbi:MAG TPA: PQQ-binding-like beta-propeller repeat protein, partial [Terriglobales bacterium]